MYYIIIYRYIVIRSFVQNPFGILFCIVLLNTCTVIRSCGQSAFDIHRLIFFSDFRTSILIFRQLSVDGAKQKFLACYFFLVLHYICLSVGNINKSSSVYLNHNFTRITMDSPKDIANFQPFFLLVWPSCHSWLKLIQYWIISGWSLSKFIGLFLSGTWSMTTVRDKILIGWNIKMSQKTLSQPLHEVSFLLPWFLYWLLQRTPDILNLFVTGIWIDIYK